jgi:hypothetical protein
MSSPMCDHQTMTKHQQHLVRRQLGSAAKNKHYLTPLQRYPCGVPGPCEAIEFTSAGWVAGVLKRFKIAAPDSPFSSATSTATGGKSRGWGTRVMAALSHLVIRLIGPIKLIVSAALAIALASPASAQPTKLNVAYTSTTTNFSIAWVAKLEGIFRKYNLDVRLILIRDRRPTCRRCCRHKFFTARFPEAIATADPNIVVIARTRYVPLRLVVTPPIGTPPT